MAAWLPYAEAVGGQPRDDADSATCAVSGKRYPKTEMLQYEGRWVSAEHRDIFFQRLREGVHPAAADAMPGPFGYAGFWIRLAAKFLDGLVLMLAWIPMVVVFAMLIPVFARPSSEPPVALILLGYAFMIVYMIGVSIGYEVYFVRKQDATPGKRILGLKLVLANGDRLSTGRIVGRYFAHMVAGFVPFYIGYILAGITKEKTGLHDMICNTRVVKTRA
jgi:uncharacterized RDD family membrane protein YckC